MYAVHCADRGLSVSSLRIHLAAILAAHRLAGIALDVSDSRLAMVVEGIVRSRGTRPRRQAAAAVLATLRRMLATRPASPSPLGLGDRALLLLGFPGRPAPFRACRTVPRRRDKGGAYSAKF